MFRHPRNYFVTLQTDIDEAAENRHDRSHFSSFKLDVEAVSLENAVRKARVLQERIQNEPFRIVSAEERPEARGYSDEYVHKALFEDAPVYARLDEDDYQSSEPVYLGDFKELLNEVIYALSETISHGLSISQIYSEFDGWNHTMIEVYDRATASYVSVGAEHKRLILDRSAVGVDGVISTAQAILDISEPLH